MYTPYSTLESSRQKNQLTKVEKKLEDWRDNFAVKSICCSFIGPKYSPYTRTGWLTTACNFSYRELTHSSGLCRKPHICCVHTHILKTKHGLGLCFRPTDLTFAQKRQNKCSQTHMKHSSEKAYVGHKTSSFSLHTIVFNRNELRTHRCIQIRQNTLETRGKRRSQNTLKQTWEHSRAKWPEVAKAVLRGRFTVINHTNREKSSQGDKLTL